MFTGKILTVFFSTFNITKKLTRKLNKNADSLDFRLEILYFGTHIHKDILNLSMLCGVFRAIASLTNT